MTTTQQQPTIRRLERGFYRSDGIHVASKDDHSPLHFTYPTGYESACNWCWLNISHSEMAHTNEMSAWAAHQPATIAQERI